MESSSLLFIYFYAFQMNFRVLWPQNIFTKNQLNIDCNKFKEYGMILYYFSSILMFFLQFIAGTVTFLKAFLCSFNIPK